MEPDAPRPQPAAPVVVPVPVARRVAFTRTRGTSVTFSWRIRLALSALPALPLIVFMWGGLGMGPLTWMFGLMTMVAMALWLPHVWTNAPLPVAASDRQDAALSADQRGTVADPSDLFTWRAAEEPAGGDEH
jgi:hypothetical protein